MRFPDVEAMFDRAVEWLRSRSKRFDHFWRAQERFFEVQAGLFSAAISYYAFFAALSLSLLALSVLGYLLELQELYLIVQQWLSENLPIIEADSIAASRQTAGIIALAALTVTGVSWVQSIRSSIRAVWLLDPEPGHPVWRVLVDFAMLIGLGVLLIATLTVTAGAEVALAWLGDGHQEGWLGQLIAWGGTAVGILVNTILAAALLTGLPRLALPLKRVLPPALWVALGLELLKTLGTLYIVRVESRAAYQAVGTAVGLLIFLYVFNQMLLFAASWTATSSRGNVLDLADERRRVDTGWIGRLAAPAPAPADDRQDAEDRTEREPPAADESPDRDAIEPPEPEAPRDEPEPGPGAGPESDADDAPEPPDPGPEALRIWPAEPDADDASGSRSATRAARGGRDADPGDDSR
ncbi:YhjD/YihY/BrkB family envelope integrity protein [Stackebrandtia albiflava]|uniref:YhjD/YihY/BrkB family envelope integrity protein n=1 Tax=Stackebrandtia albiflava TaxID=406432 RepID=UPI00131542EC|nr:YhjD/YihY/BrkB family envelope integrity protein [Stackebrandtia albiflava]